MSDTSTSAGSQPQPQPADQTGSSGPADPTSAGAASSPPPWLQPMITRLIWRLILIGFGIVVFVWAWEKAFDLIVIFIVSCFWALAILPGVDRLVRHRGWGRGLATFVVLFSLVVVILVLIGFLIPALIDVVSKLSNQVPTWLDSFQKRGITIPVLQENTSEIQSALTDWLKKNAGTHVLSIAGSSASLIAKIFLTLVFTIIIATNEPNLLRAILGKLNPSNQKRFIDAWDTAIEQTGGYFYSRLLLMVFTSSALFVAMVLLGLPVLYAVPLAVFSAFFVEFIPLVGGYIGIAFPVIVMLAEKGWVRALILLVWAIIYQQIHDYVLSPRISARTMTLSAGVALGSALLGAAIAGPMGAIFAMPVAGMVTSFSTRYFPPRNIVVSSSSLLEPPKKAPREKRFGRKRKDAEGHDSAPTST